MQTIALPQPSSSIIDQWWHDHSTTACILPKEHTEEWLDLISKVVRYYRLMRNCKNPADQKHYKNHCQHALAQSRWELMLLSIYGHISKRQMKSLEKQQLSLENTLKE